MSLLPHTELEPLHNRRYETQTYLIDDTSLLVRGALSDTKPPGLFVLDDPEPLEIHQMHLEFVVDLTTYEITDAGVEFATNPFDECPKIADHYKKLIGLSVARGFGRKVRELFGGPNGCAHTTALLQAMAPAVIQSGWSLSVHQARQAGIAPGQSEGERRELQVERNLNTCHVWADGGEKIELGRKGKLEGEIPCQIVDRLQELDRDPNEWFDR